MLARHVRAIAAANQVSDIPQHVAGGFLDALNDIVEVRPCRRSVGAPSRGDAAARALVLRRFDVVLLEDLVLDGGIAEARRGEASRLFRRHLDVRPAIELHAPSLERALGAAQSANLRVVGSARASTRSTADSAPPHSRRRLLHLPDAERARTTSDGRVERVAERNHDGSSLWFPELGFEVRPERDMTVAFHSESRYLHGVRAVTRGTRWSMTTRIEAKGCAKTGATDQDAAGGHRATGPSV